MIKFAVVLALVFGIQSGFAADHLRWYPYAGGATVTLIEKGGQLQAIYQALHARSGRNPAIYRSADKDIEISCLEFGAESDPAGRPHTCSFYFKTSSNVRVMEYRLTAQAREATGFAQTTRGSFRNDAGDAFELFLGADEVSAVYARISN